MASLRNCFCLAKCKMNLLERILESSQKFSLKGGYRKRPLNEWEAQRPGKQRDREGYTMSPRHSVRCHCRESLSLSASCPTVPPHIRFRVLGRENFYVWARITYVLASKSNKEYLSSFLEGNRVLPSTRVTWWFIQNMRAAGSLQRGLWLAWNCIAFGGNCHL